MALISLGNNRVYAASCWKGTCIIKQDDTLLHIAKEMEKSTQAIAGGEILEQPQIVKEMEKSTQAMAESEILEQPQNVKEMEKIDTGNG